MLNNAGVTTTGPFVDVDPASIPRDIGINLVAPLHIIHTVAPWMWSPGGAIVNTISLALITPLAGSSVYSATKFGLRGFNIALHMEVKGARDHRIRRAAGRDRHADAAQGDARGRDGAQFPWRPVATGEGGEG